MKYNNNQETWTIRDLTFWREGKKWCCAVPRDDIATRNGFSWKEYGLIGHGKTKEEAQEDWESCKRCSDLVADIF